MPAKFTVGQRYYSFHQDDTGPVIQTWNYCGLLPVEGCSSTSCDVPYHFHVFELTAGPGHKKQHVRFPSLEVAKRLQLTWAELLRAIAAIGWSDRKIAGDQTA